MYAAKERKVSKNNQQKYKEAQKRGIPSKTICSNSLNKSKVSQKNALKSNQNGEANGFAR
jgi:hypothetical protein